VEASAKSWTVHGEGQSWTVHGRGKCKILPFTMHGGGQFRILHRARWRQVQDPSLHRARFRILHRARWRQVQDPSLHRHSARWRQVQDPYNMIRLASDSRSGASYCSIYQRPANPYFSACNEYRDRANERLKKVRRELACYWPLNYIVGPEPRRGIKDAANLLKGRERVVVQRARPFIDVIAGGVHGSTKQMLSGRDGVAAVGRHTESPQPGLLEASMSKSSAMSPSGAATCQAEHKPSTQPFGSLLKESSNFSNSSLGTVSPVSQWRAFTKA